MQKIVLLLAAVANHVTQTAAQNEIPEFAVNPGVPGGGGTGMKQSAHFQFFNAAGATADPAKAETMLKLLESAHECWTNEMGWRSSGNSYNTAANDGPKYKMNAYAVASPKDIGGAGGVMGSDPRTGHAFIKVVQNAIAIPGTSVHEYGHAMTYYLRNWVDQGRTGTWWEPVAEYFADTYMTSQWCAAARTKYGFKASPSIMQPAVVLSKSHLVLVDGTPNQGQYYQSWPFLAYLTYNPDQIMGLGKSAVKDMIVKYKVRSNETPLHSLERMVAPIPVSKVVANYWGRMSHGEIGHPNGRQAFTQQKARIRFDALAPGAEGTYKIKAEKAPKYMGAGIHPIKASGGQASITVTADTPFTALVAVRSKAGAIKLVDLKNGTGEVKYEAGDEANLVVVNTPAQLVLYNGFEIAKSDAAKQMTYSIKIQGGSL